MATVGRPKSLMQKVMLDLLYKDNPIIERYPDGYITIATNPYLKASGLNNTVVWKAVLEDLEAHGLVSEVSHRYGTTRLKVQMPLVYYR